MKKFLFLAAALLIPLISSASSMPDMLLFTANGRADYFTDTSALAWYSEYVRTAAETGIVSGYADVQQNSIHKFGPNDPVTIGQILKIAFLGAGYDPEDFIPDGMPKDPSAHWARDYWSVAAVNSFNFTRDTYMLDPRQVLDRKATRAEVASIVADAFLVDIQRQVGNRYSDVNTASKFGPAIEALSQEGILSGDTDSSGQIIGRFRPDDFINRAEVVKIAMKARDTFGKPAAKSEEPQIFEMNEYKFKIPATWQAKSEDTAFYRVTNFLEDNTIVAELRCPDPNSGGHGYAAVLRKTRSLGINGQDRFATLFVGKPDNQTPGFYRPGNTFVSIGMYQGTEANWYERENIPHSCQLTARLPQYTENFTLWEDIFDSIRTK